jgi:hypothetical protein
MSYTRTLRRRCFCRLSSIIAIIWLSSAAPALAVDRHWGVSSGSWENSANWVGAFAPGPSDNAILDRFVANNGGSARVATSVGPVASVTVLNDGTVVISNQGTLLCSGDFIAGQLNTFGTLRMLPTNPPAPFPGGLTIGANLRIGVFSGVGGVIQNDGTITVGNHVIVGDSNDPNSIFKADAVYVLSGGTLRAPTIDVGYSSSVPFNLNSAANGTFIQQGSGVVNAGTFGVGRQAGVNILGSGVVNQSGGTMNVANELTIGFSHNFTSGSYNLSGGVLNSAKTFVNGGSTLTFSGGTLSAGTLDVAGKVKLTAGANKILRASALFFRPETGTPGGVVDLNDNKMIATFGTPGENVRNLIRQGYNGGAWNGPRLTSSAAADNPGHTTALGYGLTPQGELIVKYTYYGDADLNGVVDFDDYSHTDNGFITHGSDWLHGDFDYNGQVDFDDYSRIDLSFNNQSGTLRRAMSYLDGGDRSDAGMDEPALQMVRQHLQQFGEGYAASFLNAVPEPGLVPPFAVVAMVLRRHRRRRLR